MSNITHTKVKSIFEDNTESFGIQNEERNNQTEMRHNDHHDHADQEDLQSCESLSVCLSEEESDEESEMDDDYNPNTGTSSGAADKDDDSMKKNPSMKRLPTKSSFSFNKLKSTLSLKKLKTVVFPIKQSKAEKKDKLIQFAKGTNDDDGALLDDKKDEEASIQQETIDKLVAYYGSKVTFVIFILIHVGLNSLRSYSAYLIGEWANNKDLQTDP